MEAFETYEHEGISVEFHYDELGAEYANPRENDEGNLATMVCWHPDYVLGDLQLRDGAGRGAVENDMLDEWPLHGYPRDMRTLARYLTLMQKAIGLRPLYLYDHSGISIRAGSPSPFDNPRVHRDEFGQGMGWDTTMVGFVYTTHERISELCGEEERYHSEEWVNEQVEDEVETYNDYLTGAVYGYVVARGTEDEASCWGFLGDPDTSGLREEANAEAAGIAEERARLRALPWLPTFGNPIRKAIAV